MTVSLAKTVGKRILMAFGLNALLVAMLGLLATTGLTKIHAVVEKVQAGQDVASLMPVVQQTKAIVLMTSVAAILLIVVMGLMVSRAITKALTDSSS
ncbi:MAG: hypothetical protein JXQ73_27950 [Phycisphaerae bacterium]|nr:hypothetical protein [Phycisphaerae bacterium]